MPGTARPRPLRIFAIAQSRLLCVLVRKAGAQCGACRTPERWSSWRRLLGRSRLRGWRDVTKNFAVPAHSNVAHAWRLGARSRRNGAWRRRSEQRIGLRPPAIVELRSHVEHGSDPVRPASQSDAPAQPRQITAAASPSQPISLQTPGLQISISAPRFGRPNSCRFCVSYIQTGHCERTTPPRGI